MYLPLVLSKFKTFQLPKILSHSVLDNLKYSQTLKQSRFLEESVINAGEQT